MSTLQYIQLLDWTSCRVIDGKRGSTPADTPDVLDRPGVSYAEWIGMVDQFGRLFSLVAGHPTTLSRQRSRRTHHSFHTRRSYRELFLSTAV